MLDDGALRMFLVWAGGCAPAGALAGVVCCVLLLIGLIFMSIPILNILNQIAHINFLINFLQL